MPELTALALDIGFECASEFDAGKLTFSPEVRGMCASGRCKRYGKCWSCPPACGTRREVLALCAGADGVQVGRRLRRGGPEGRRSAPQAPLRHAHQAGTPDYTRRLPAHGRGLLHPLCKVHISRQAMPPSRQALAEYGGLRHTRVQRMQKRRARLLSRPGNDNVFILHTNKFIN